MEAWTKTEKKTFNHTGRLLRVEHVDGETVRLLFEDGKEMIYNAGPVFRDIVTMQPGKVWVYGEKRGTEMHVIKMKRQ